MSAKPVRPPIGENLVDVVEAVSNFIERRWGGVSDFEERARLQRRLAAAVALEFSDRAAAEAGRRDEARMWDTAARGRR